MLIHLKDDLQKKCYSPISLILFKLTLIREKHQVVRWTKWIHLFSQGSIVPTTKCTRMPIMPILASESLLRENENYSNKILPQVSLSHWPRIPSPACSPYSNWPLVCKAKHLGSLYSHALFIPTKSSKVQKPTGAWTEV